MCVQEFLDGEKRNNEEKEKSLGVMERKAAKTRLTYQESEAARLAFKNEVCEATSTSIPHLKFEVCMCVCVCVAGDAEVFSG